MMKHMLCIISKVDCFSLCYTIFIVNNDFIAKSVVFPPNTTILKLVKNDNNSC